MSSVKNLDLYGGFLDVTRIAGDDAAKRLTQARGGNRVYFPRPKTLTDGHWLVVAVGTEAAQLLCEHLQGSTVDIPMGRLSIQAYAREIAERALADGKTGSEAARLSGLHTRTIFRYKVRLADLRRFSKAKRKGNAA